MHYDDALRYLDDHASYEKTGRIDAPSLDRITRIVGALGDPQSSYPVIHITGTNGKGSTAQMITRLLMAHGLQVGTYTSPHLERVNERMARNGEPISDDDFAEQVAAIADIEGLIGVRPSYFEVCTAAAFRWFADTAVDVAVVEVGLLGRWDATNVVRSDVAVVTNIGLDHTEFAGPTKADIAREKAGIIKPTGAAVIGETDPELLQIFREADPSSMLVRGEDFDVADNQLALGGRLVDLRTPTTIYPEMFLPLHGRHQADNAAVALDRGGDVLRPPAQPGPGGRGLRRGARARPLRGARAPAARDHRRRPQRRWRRRLRHGVLRGLRSRRPSPARGRLLEGPGSGRHAERPARRRVRPGDLLHRPVTAGPAWRRISPQQRARSAATT